MNLIQDVLSAASTQPEQDHFARIKLADILPDPPKISTKQTALKNWPLPLMLSGWNSP